MTKWTSLGTFVVGSILWIQRFLRELHDTSSGSDRPGREPNAKGIKPTPLRTLGMNGKAEVTRLDERPVKAAARGRVLSIEGLGSSIASVRPLTSQELANSEKATLYASLIERPYIF